MNPETGAFDLDTIPNFYTHNRHATTAAINFVLLTSWTSRPPTSAQHAMIHGTVIPRPCASLAGYCGGRESSSKKPRAKITHRCKSIPFDSLSSEYGRRYSIPSFSSADLGVTHLDAGIGSVRDQWHPESPESINPAAHNPRYSCDQPTRSSTHKRLVDP